MNIYRTKVIARTCWNNLFIYVGIFHNSRAWPSNPAYTVADYYILSGGSCSSSLVSLEVFSPAQILSIVQTTATRHWFFISSFFLFFFTLKFKRLFFLSSFYSLLCSFLLYLAFFSNLLSFYFSFPITLFCLLLRYVLLLFNLFSFYYSSSFRVLYLIPIFHLLCSSFCFLWTPSSLGEDSMIYLLSFFPSFCCSVSCQFSTVYILLLFPFTLSLVLFP